MNDKLLYFGSNLKMYKTARETAEYVEEIAALTADLEREPVKRFLIPSFTSLPAAGAKAHSGLLLGAQNMHWEDCGQFTGEVSPRMLEELGFVSIVEIGHSERRHVFHETSSECNKKVLSALSHGFTALLCVGETAEEKSFGVSDEVLAMQIKIGLSSVSAEDISSGRVWLAYEPVWAIGVGGEPADPEYVSKRHGYIRKLVCRLFPQEGQQVPLLFGGSVNPDNANSYIRVPDVDGLFVGRAAWTAPTFNALLRQVMPEFQQKFACGSEARKAGNRC